MTAPTPEERAENACEAGGIAPTGAACAAIAAEIRAAVAEARAEERALVSVRDCLQAFEAGAAEMRERAADLARASTDPDSRLADEIRALPLRWKP